MIITSLDASYISFPLWAHRPVSTVAEAGGKAMRLSAAEATDARGSTLPAGATGGAHHGRDQYGGGADVTEGGHIERSYYAVAVSVKLIDWHCIYSCFIRSTA